MEKRKVAVALLLCLLVLFAGTQEVRADEQEKKDFSCEVGVLRQEDDRYVLQVVAANEGKDFTGTVRLIFTMARGEACAFDTELVLPEGGEKQFTVQIPSEDVDTIRGKCTVVFLDEEEEELQRIALKNVFGNSSSGFSVGILSDEYGDLTYLDLGGMDFYIQNLGEPLQLVELDADNFESYLDGLYFLVIDRYDVASLGEEKVAAIEEWVEAGGWLLIGTGAYGEQTLGGFDDDFLEISAVSAVDSGKQSFVEGNANNGYYYSWIEVGVDFSQMELAELVYSSQNPYFFESSQNPALCMNLGEGSVSVYACSLGDPELKKGNQSIYAEMLSETMYNSNSYSTLSNYTDMAYLGEQAMSVIDRENTDVSFTVLEILIAVYVVLVGPVLYLILRKCKKSEWYWVGAPVLGLVFILGVFVFGRDLRVVDTKVYSVSLQQAGSAKVETYYDAYRSGTKEWRMRLNDNYDLGGQGFTGYGSSSSADYHYLARTDSEGLSLGMNPSENFESGFLFASGRADGAGNFVCEDLGGKISGYYQSSGGSSDLHGTVTNDTGRDLKYLALRTGSYLMIFSDVGAGESLDVEQALGDGRLVYEVNFSYMDDLIYELGFYNSSSSPAAYEERIGKDEMAALFIGIGVAEEHWDKDRDGLCLVGLAKDAEKTVADRCDETAYACVYGYGEMDVETEVMDDESDYWD